MRIINEPKLDFDDVLIKPKPTELSSRSQVNLEVSYICKHSKARFNGLPLIVSNMDTSGQISVAEKCSQEKVWVALHKFYNNDVLEKFLQTEYSQYCFVSAGISEDEIEKIKRLSEKIKIRALCIEAANAYMYTFLDSVKKYRDMLPNCILLAGNVATPEGVENLIKSGADIAKCGIANGFFCRTKEKTGIGYKQFAVAAECGQAANEINALCCSDGGCKSSGDICKALGAGSHMVMCGSIFGGVEEAVESEWITNSNNQKFMKMYGMSSLHANNKYFGGIKSYRTSEGHEEWIESKGSIIDVIQDVKGGLASCCTYTNTRNLENLHKNCEFTI